MEPACVLSPLEERCRGNYHRAIRSQNEVKSSLYVRTPGYLGIEPELVCGIQAIDVSLEGTQWEHPAVEHGGNELSRAAGEDRVSVDVEPAAFILGHAVRISDDERRESS